MEEAVETQKAIEKHASENLDTIIPSTPMASPRSRVHGRTI